MLASRYYRLDNLGIKINYPDLSWRLFQDFELDLVF